MSSRPVWFTEWVPGQPGLHRETGLGEKNEQKVIFCLCELSLCFVFFREDYFAKKNEERKQSKVEDKLKAKQ